MAYQGCFLNKDLKRVHKFLFSITISPVKALLSFISIVYFAEGLVLFYCIELLKYGVIRL